MGRRAGQGMQAQRGDEQCQAQQDRYRLACPPATDLLSDQRQPDTGDQSRSQGSEGPRHLMPDPAGQMGNRHGGQEAHDRGHDSRHSAPADRPSTPTRWVQRPDRPLPRRRQPNRSRRRGVCPTRRRPALPPTLRPARRPPPKSGMPPDPWRPSPRTRRYAPRWHCAGSVQAAPAPLLPKGPVARATSGCSPSHH